MRDLGKVKVRAANKRFIQMQEKQGLICIQYPGWTLQKLFITVTHLVVPQQLIYVYNILRRR